MKQMRHMVSIVVNGLIQTIILQAFIVESLITVMFSMQ